MSLFSIVKTVMDSNGWPAPVTAVAASQDQNMRQSMALANLALKQIAFKHNWPVLIREERWDTLDGIGDYPLPADFHHMVVPSAVNAGQYFQLKGNLTPIQWYRKSLNGSIDWGDGYRIDAVNGRLVIAPTPMGHSDLVYMYITNEIVAAATTANFLNYMNRMWIKLVRGTDRPDLIVADDAYYMLYWGALLPNQRFTSSGMASSGFESLRYMNADVVFDGGQGGAAPANHMYFLNTDYIYLRPHTDRQYVPLNPDRYTNNQDAFVKLIGWAGNMTTSGRKFQGVLKD